MEFPPCVQWLTIEFDPQCGTAQMEDYLLLSIPVRPTVPNGCASNDDYFDMLDKDISLRRAGCKNANIISSCNRAWYSKYAVPKEVCEISEKDWIVIKKYNT